MHQMAISCIADNRGAADMREERRAEQSVREVNFTRLRVREVKSCGHWAGVGEVGRMGREWEGIGEAV